MGRDAVQRPKRDRRGLVSLEYAVLAAAVASALVAGAGTVKHHVAAPMAQIEASANGMGVSVRISPF